MADEGNDLALQLLAEMPEMKEEIQAELGLEMQISEETDPEEKPAEEIVTEMCQGDENEEENITTAKSTDEVEEIMQVGEDTDPEEKPAEEVINEICQEEEEDIVTPKSAAEAEEIMQLCEDTDLEEKLAAEVINEICQEEEEEDATTAKSTEEADEVITETCPEQILTAKSAEEAMPKQSQLPEISKAPELLTADQQSAKRLTRKRENADNGNDDDDDDSAADSESSACPPITAPTPPKQFRIDQVTERKSIIEIHIANDDVKKSSAASAHTLLSNVATSAEAACLPSTSGSQLSNIALDRITEMKQQIIKEINIIKTKNQEDTVLKNLNPELNAAEGQQLEANAPMKDQQQRQSTEVSDKQKQSEHHQQEEHIKNLAIQSKNMQQTTNLQSQPMNTEKPTNLQNQLKNPEAAIPQAYITHPAAQVDDMNKINMVRTRNSTKASIAPPPTNHDDNSNHSQTEEEMAMNLEQLTAEEELKDQEHRKSCKVFLQHLPCFKLQNNANPSTAAPNCSSSEDNDNSNSKSNTPQPCLKIHKCRECRRRTPQQGTNDVYCRFYEFRCLQYTKEGLLLVAGFPNPYTDHSPEELNIWQPDENTEPTAGFMDIQVCRYILLHVGDQFCYLWRQEAEALKIHENPNGTIAWKKIVQGIREICDVCDTTLFNFHWTCEKCGFGVCIDCFKDRKENKTVRKLRVGAKQPPKGRDDFYWLFCSGGATHHLKDLILTQIIAGDALNVLGRLLHDVRTLWEIPQLCECLLSKQQLPDGDLKTLIQDMIKESRLKEQTSASSLATAETLRKQARLEQIHSKALEFAKANGMDCVPWQMHNKQTLGKDPITTAFDKLKHINFLRRGLSGLRRFLPPRAMTLAHSTLLAPGVPHEWLCDGKLLRLTNANHPDNRMLFQEVWKCGQPVMISEVAKSLNLDLWRPEAFLKDFGEKPNDLINCLNGNLVPNQPMRHFWEGFQCMKKRLLDHNGKPMLLKLKDWPPGDDFAEILPTRYKDLMKGLPMPEYTLRTGNLNIASCLPKMFVPPDLGPKMYNAYGSAFHPDKGTTNLHLDISDAVNIMVYVGIPEDSDSKSQISATHKAIAMGGCDFLTRSREIANKNVMPGALWHIFPARDADKIRDLLNRVTLESGYRLEPDHDPIHDQNWYLDDKLRARLFKEYGVEGYPIVQCLGDAVFIPAGAPHQVQNLHNCIKVAEDFVSPENITHCFHLTHEFRRLSHSHTNHEDKLQIKNIIYHAIKDCCTILTRALEKRLDQEIEKAEVMKAKLENAGMGIDDDISH